ncbi:MAG: hypothetical protein ACOCYE_09615 [Pseudomonadota bacterium]
MRHLLFVVPVLLATPTALLAGDAAITVSGRDGAPVASDPTLSFAIATVAFCVALYLVHRMVNRKVR